jgi:hypothetical protein
MQIMVMITYTGLDDPMPRRPRSRRFSRLGRIGGVILGFRSIWIAVLKSRVISHRYDCADTAGRAAILDELRATPARSFL